MDLEEWELLPDDGFLEIHDDGGGKKIFSRKYGNDPIPRGGGVFKMNYFVCPSPKKSPEFVESTDLCPRVPNQLVPLPIQLEPTPDYEVVKEIIECPFEMKVMPSAMIAGFKAPGDEGEEGQGPLEVEADQDPVSSQVFFKKMKETEFVDMKMDSPKSSNNRGFFPQIDVGTFQFEPKTETYNNKDDSPEAKSNMKGVISMNPDDFTDDESWEGSSGGLNIWKWSLTGIGAICSFGVAAATICIFIFGSRKRSRQHQQNQKLRFQMYTDDKRIKQVVHHATKLNEAISAVRGVPLTRAHITFGGYYEGL